MAQFNPESLARLLTQVEREVLVEAAEAAAIDPLLTTPRGETLDELAEWLNFLSNMLVLAPAIDAIAAEELVRRMLGATTVLPPGAIKGIAGALGYFNTLLDKVGILQSSIDDIGRADLDRLAIYRLALVIPRTVGYIKGDLDRNDEGAYVWTYLDTIAANGRDIMDMTR